MTCPFPPPGTCAEHNVLLDATPAQNASVVTGNLMENTVFKSLLRIAQLLSNNNLPGYNVKPDLIVVLGQRLKRRSVVSSTGCSPRGPAFDIQNPPGSSHLSKLQLPDI